MSSKKDLDFDKLSSLKPKKEQANTNPEKAVQAIHQKVEAKDKVKRVTIDLPFSTYVEIKRKITLEEKTLKDYFLGLARKDL